MSLFDSLRYLLEEEEEDYSLEGNDVNQDLAVGIKVNVDFTNDN